MQLLSLHSKTWVWESPSVQKQLRHRIDAKETIQTYELPESVTFKLTTNRAGVTMPLSNKQPRKTRDRARGNNLPSVTDRPFTTSPFGGDDPEVNIHLTNKRTVTQLRTLSKINHGLKFPDFDPNTYFAANLFSDSSSLPRTTKDKADEALQSIEEKRLTMKVVQANIGLNQDVVRAGTAMQTLSGLAIDYAKTRIDNQTKYIGFQTAGVRQQIAQAKFDQAQEQLTQEEYAYNGMQLITPLVRDEWVARVQLKKSKISDLKVAALRASAAMEATLSQMEGDFRQDLQAL
jgi:hypothetical protein